MVQSEYVHNRMIHGFNLIATMLKKEEKKITIEEKEAHADRSWRSSVLNA